MNSCRPVILGDKYISSVIGNFDTLRIVVVVIFTCRNEFLKTGSTFSWYIIADFSFFHRNCFSVSKFYIIVLFQINTLLRSNFVYPLKSKCFILSKSNSSYSSSKELFHFSSLWYYKYTTTSKMSLMTH